MNNYLFVLLLLPFVTLTGQPNLGSITKAINNGDADALGQYFDESVEIAILDSEDLYSKSQAVGKVRGFFEQSKPKSFSQVHQGVSKGQDSQYCIGNLVTVNGAYRVYIYMKVADGRTVIQELRFDKS